MTGQVVRRLLAEQNGGPGLTVDEMAAQTGFDRSDLRAVLAKMIFQDGDVTCVHDTAAKVDRFLFGDPAPLITLG